ncbi:MAG TPA: trypsin-like serine protease [Candidatus Binatia bacterium]|nr:trypsin-like serine protease [Candidatus Binatia bacterium]
MLLALAVAGLSPTVSLAGAGGTPGPTPREIDEAVRFREKLGLRADRAFVAQTFRSSLFKGHGWGVPLDAAEAGELGRRMKAEKAAAKALRHWAADSASAGAYIDQPAGGVITFLTTGDPSRGRRELAPLLPDAATGAKIRFERVERSMDDLLALQARIDADLRAGALASLGVVSTAIDARANAVHVGVAADTPEVRDALASRYGLGVVAAFEPPAQGGDADDCTSRSECPPAKGGIEIRSTYNGANCTSAFMVRVAGSGEPRLLTAGHCVAMSGGIGTSRTWTHDGKALAWAEITTWANGADADVAVLAPTQGTVDEDRNLLFRASSTDVVPITGMRATAEQVQGGMVCRGGAVSGWHCGTIALTNRTKSVDGRTIDHQWVVDFDACPGDSGGPYVLDDVAYGLHTDSSWGCEPSKNQAWYTPIGWALTVLASKGHPVELCTTLTCGAETNVWTQRDGLGHPVWNPQLVRLDDGRVLQVGGLARDPLGLAPDATDLPAPALFDPVSGTWSEAATPPWAPAECEGQFAVGLDDGRVLVGGGRRLNQGDPSACDGAFLFDPAAAPEDAWAPAEMPPVALVSAGAALLGDGRALVVGGNGPAGSIAVALAYDPATDDWATLDPPPAGALSPLVLRLLDGRVLVSGGYTLVADGAGRADVTGTYLYNPSTGSWSTTSAVGAFGRAGTVLDDGRAVLAGGQHLSWNDAQQTSYVDAVNVLSPGAGTWSTLPALPNARAAFSLAQLPNGLLLAAAGRVPGGGPLGQMSKTAVAYDFASKAWYDAPSLDGARAGQGTAVLADGTVLVVGGGSGSVESYVAGDILPPKATVYSSRLSSGLMFSSSGIPVRLSWSGSDTGGSGIGTYDIARSIDGGAWQTIATKVPHAWVDAWIPTSHNVRFQVRPRDWAGNMGAWKVGGAVRLSIAQESGKSVTWSGTWKRLTVGGYAGGAARYSKTAGASATYRFTGRGIGFVTTKGPTLGKAKIYIDGRYVTTVNLYSSSWQYRFVAYQKTWSTAGDHRIKVVNAGTYGHSRVDVDAFVVFNTP